MYLSNESEKEDLLTPKETRYNEMSPREIFTILKEVSTATISVIFSTIGSVLKDVISLYFIGHLDNPLLFAAVGFGLTWANSFGTL